MGFHDQIAVRARLDGQTSALFRQAAQNKANGTWSWLFVAAIVWYLAGWMWALIPIAIAVFRAVQSISATLVAQRLETTEKQPPSPTA